MRCTMCGYEFETTDLECHTGCPLAAACSVICCPRCGYSTVDPSRSGVSNWFQRLLGRKQCGVDAPSGCIPLLSLQVGQEAQISSMEGDKGRLHILNQYGLLPGTPVRLTQRRPVPIVQVGQTDLALDSSVAASIFVEV